MQLNDAQKAYFTKRDKQTHLKTHMLPIGEQLQHKQSNYLMQQSKTVKRLKAASPIKVQNEIETDQMTPIQQRDQRLTLLTPINQIQSSPKKHQIGHILTAQKKQESLGGLEKLEIVPEQNEKLGQVSHLKRKLDAVLTEGNMRLPNPSSSENYKNGSELIQKRMPALGSHSPPQINCMTGSNPSGSQSNISPGVTQQTFFQRSTIIFQNQEQIHIKNSDGKSDTSIGQQSGAQKVIKPLPCPKLPDKFGTPNQFNELPQSLAMLNSSDEKLPRKLDPITPSQANYTS